MSDIVNGRSQIFLQGMMDRRLVGLIFGFAPRLMVKGAQASYKIEPPIEE